MANNSNYQKIKKINKKDASKVYIDLIKKHKKQILIGAIVILLFSLFIGGLLAQLFGQTADKTISLFASLKYAFTTATGRFISIFTFIALIIGSVVVATKNLLDDDNDPIKNITHSDRGTYGTSRYLKPYEYSEFLDVVDSPCETTGFIFGKTEDGKIVAMKRDSEVTNRNIAACGAQGTGKSRGLIRPMIIQCAINNASMVIMDTKSELTADCAAYLHSKGYHVAVFNLINQWNSNGWDILGEFDSEENVSVICDSLIRNSGGDNKGDFFDNIETVLLQAVCLYVYETYPAGRRNIGEAYQLLINNKPDELDAKFDKLREEKPMSNAVGQYTLFDGAASNKGNAILGLGSRLRIFRYEFVKQITGKNDIELKKIAQEKTALFLVMSASNQTYNLLASTMISMLFNEIFEYAQQSPNQRCDIPVEFLLDEFPNVGYIDGFANKLAVARSYDIGIHIMFQNIPQFYNRYEQNMATELLGGCNYNLYLGCNEPITSQYYSTLMGNATQKVRTEDENKGSFLNPALRPSAKLGDGQRPVEYEDELRRYAKDELYLQVNGKKPIKLKKFDYSEHPESLLMRKVVATELVPDWRIVNGRDLETGEKVDEDKIITTNKWLELTANDSDKIPALTVKTKEGTTKEMSRLCVEDSEIYGPSRSKLIKQAKRLKEKYKSKGQTPNGQPFLADNPLATYNPNPKDNINNNQSKAGSVISKLKVVNGTILDKNKEYKNLKFADEVEDTANKTNINTRPRIMDENNTSNVESAGTINAASSQKHDNFSDDSIPETQTNNIKPTILTDPVGSEVKENYQTINTKDLKPVEPEKEEVKIADTSLKEGLLPDMNFKARPKKKKKDKQLQK